ncbi:hypothetical protein [Actinoplanes sp. NPDC023714]|uniref:hypothetical protein n=1 Tax=Actinoplanes sp. NPDC023714 TaxID=3154322 RepID=UPI0033CD94A5
MNQPAAHEDLWPEQWAVQASVDADRMLHRVTVARARTLTGAETASASAVEAHLRHTHHACRRAGARRRRRWRDKWRGTSVDRAYRNLHAAKVFLVDLLTKPELDALVPDVTTRLQMVLDRNDPRRMDAEQRLMKAAPEPEYRAAMKQAMETAYEGSDEEYVRLRDFRNIVLLTAAAIALATGVLITMVALFPASIPLCFMPDVTGAGPPDATTVLPTVCPSGETLAGADVPRPPSSADITIVAGLGAVGGLLGAIVAIRNLRGTSTPYATATALAILKVPTGALCAIIGMLLLAGEFVPGLSELDSQRQILAYAVLFGIAQQLVTRVADDRAQQILERLPSKDPQAQPAQPSAKPPSLDTQAEPATSASATSSGTAAPRRRRRLRRWRRR